MCLLTRIRLPAKIYLSHVQSVTGNRSTGNNYKIFCYFAFGGWQSLVGKDCLDCWLQFADTYSRTHYNCTGIQMISRCTRSDYKGWYTKIKRVFPMWSYKRIVLKINFKQGQVSYRELLNKHKRLLSSTICTKSTEYRALTHICVYYG